MREINDFLLATDYRRQLKKIANKYRGYTTEWQVVAPNTFQDIAHCINDVWQHHRDLIHNEVTDILKNKTDFSFRVKFIAWINMNWWQAEK